MEQAFFDEEHVILEHHIGKVPILYTDGRLFPDVPLYSEVCCSNNDCNKYCIMNLDISLIILL
jgi:hypothetical protein